MKKNISSTYSFRLLSILILSVNITHTNYEAIDAFFAKEQQEEQQEERLNTEREARLAQKCKYLLEGVKPCQDSILLSTFQRIKTHMGIHPTHEIGLNQTLISPLKRLCSESLGAYSYSRMSHEEREKYEESIYNSVDCEYTHTPRAKKTLNMPDESINLNGSRFKTALPATQIRLLYQTVHEIKQAHYEKYKIQDQVSSKYFPTTNELYYNRELAAANHINCPECLRQWKETAPTNQIINPFIDARHISKETLESIIESKKSQQCCAAHANIPLKCLPYALLTKISPSEGTFQKFEKCLNKPLSAYLPRAA